MTEVFLGVIAVSVLLMAGIQVAAIVFAARAARRVGEAVARLEQEVRPIVANLHSVSAEAARATALATAQVERANRMFEDLSARLDQTLVTVQQSIAAPAREGMAFFHGLRGMLAAFRQRGDAARQRPASVEEEDALFIG